MQEKNSLNACHCAALVEMLKSIIVAQISCLFKHFLAALG